MTIWGIAPELFGYNDARLNLKDLLRPTKACVRGSIELTIDKELQTFICSLLKQKGVENAAAVVSNWRTDEILAAVSLPAALPGESEDKQYIQSTLQLGVNNKNHTDSCCAEY